MPWKTIINLPIIITVETPGNPGNHRFCPKNLDILWVKFDSKRTFEDHVPGIVSRVSRRIGILRLVKHVVADACVTSLLLFICSHNPWVLFSGVGVSCWMSSSAFRAQMYTVARLCTDQTFLSLCHQCLLLDGVCSTKHKYPYPY